MTDTEVVNAAIVALGCVPISALGDLTTAEGRVAAAQYPTIRDAFVQSRQWTWAKSRMQLSQDASPPPFEYAFRYVIPNTVLDVIRVFDGNVTNLVASWDDFWLPQVKWIREGAFVLTNSDSPVFAEVKLKVAEGAIPPLAVKALIAQCAADWAIPLTENRALSDSWDTKAMNRLMLAAFEDGKQGTSEQITPAKLPGRRR